jgi:acyl transferase domain-containing protein
MGHSEAASGLTSIIKVALAFEHGVIPPTYGVKNLNPKCKPRFALITQRIVLADNIK